MVSVKATQLPDDYRTYMADGLQGYTDCINYADVRTKGKAEIRVCVMCGEHGTASGQPPEGYSGYSDRWVKVPAQNKDVCTSCDGAVWRRLSARRDVFFKWCKGCKKFLQVSGVMPQARPWFG